MAIAKDKVDGKFLSTKLPEDLWAACMQCMQHQMEQLQQIKPCIIGLNVKAKMMCLKNDKQ